jgi:DNA-3-methyladenine glycosylase
VAPTRIAFSNPYPRKFFDRPTTDVAKDLVGAILARQDSQGGLLAARIVETEAYIAGDPANHAWKGPTRRNWTMFTGPGHLYVYRIHQVHCANATTIPAEAVLLRAAEPLTPGLGSMRGPGLLCRAFSLTKEEDGLDLTTDARVRILPSSDEPLRIDTARRIGIRLGKDYPLRFAARGSKEVSRPIPARPGSSSS